MQLLCILPDLRKMGVWRDVEVTIESLKLGVHVLRNPTIYNIFLKTGLVTDAGSGIPRIIRVLRKVTGREPDFRLEGTEFIIVLRRAVEGG